jgi:catechol 2,3-dioxygenase-like lactoylglutathione lyase family enzyme
MMKLDHLNLPVSNLERSRDWWVKALGLAVEFEVPETRTVALNDGEGFAIFLQEKPQATSGGVAVWFQVEDVDATYAAWTARGVAFAHAPRKNFWGYGPELADPDGYLVRLWDETSMKEK